MDEYECYFLPGPEEEAALKRKHRPVISDGSQQPERETFLTEQQQAFCSDSDVVEPKSLEQNGAIPDDDPRSNYPEDNLGFAFSPW